MGWSFNVPAWIKSLIKSKPVIITADQLKMICPALTIDRCRQLADLHNELCAKYGITTKDVFHEFFANVTQESLEYQHKVENMNYRAETLMKVWKDRFPNMAVAQNYAHQPEKLANFVYGGRMGNNRPGDGWLFRGGGFPGITGRETYTKYAEFIHNTVEVTADLIRNSDYWALDCAYWFFCVLKDLEDEAEKDDFIGIVKSWNGGQIGLKDRQHYYELAKKYII